MAGRKAVNNLHMNMLKLVARLTLGVNDFYNFAGSTPAIHKRNFIFYASTQGVGSAFIINILIVR